MGRAADKYVHPLPPPTVFMATSHSQPSRQLPRAGAPTLLQLHIASGVRMGFVVTHKLLCLDCLRFPPSNVTLTLWCAVCAGVARLWLLCCRKTK